MRKTCIYKGITFNKYEVDDQDGQIYRKGSVNHLKGFDNGMGYDMIDLMTDDNIRVRGKRHIIVAHTYLGPQPENTIVNHLNGIKKDCRPKNLEYDTQRGNVAHAQRLIKNKPYYEKDTWDQVDELKSEGKSLVEISRILSIPYYIIRDRHQGKTYQYYSK